MFDQRTVKAIVAAFRVCDRSNDFKLDALSVILEAMWKEENAKTVATQIENLDTLEYAAMKAATENLKNNIGGLPSKLAACKEVRMRTGWDLKQAKEFCDKLFLKMGWN